MFIQIVSTIIALVALLTFAPASAQSAADHASHHSEDATKAGVAPKSEGEVRKVDRDAGKVTIRHGELRNLDMPAMTMVFRVKDPAMLAELKEGDRIRFTAEKVDGNFTVTELQRVK